MSDDDQLNLLGEEPPVRPKRKRPRRRPADPTLGGVVGGPTVDDESVAGVELPGEPNETVDTSGEKRELAATPSEDPGGVDPIGSDDRPTDVIEPDRTAAVGVVPDDSDGDGSPGESSDVMALPTTDEAPHASEGGLPTVPGLATTVYYLTNRLNLISVLSSRLVAPRAAYQKYYADLLDRFPGWVPLLHHAPSPRMLEIVTSERGAGVAVIVEFPADGNSRAGGLVADDVTFVTSLALGDAAAIHFPDEKSLREHRARSFGNVHTHDELLRVTPELFESGPVTWELPEPTKAARTVDWQEIDRIRGSVSAAVAAATSGEQLAIAAGVLGAADVPDDAAGPPWLAWAELFGAKLGVSTGGPPSPDEQLFRAIYEVLGTADVTRAWNPREILDAVEARFIASDSSTRTTDLIGRNLHRVREIVNVEKDFEPFRSRGNSLTSAKALLLVLLRPDLSDLLSWDEQETGADDATRVTAAVLAGRLRGLARESIALRSTEIDDLTARWASRCALGERTTLGQVQFVAATGRTEIGIDGRLLKRAAPLQDPAAQYSVIPDERKERLRVEVARSMGWQLAKRVRLSGVASLEHEHDVLVVVAMGDVDIHETIDEQGFLDRIAQLDRRQRSAVCRILTG